MYFSLRTLKPGCVVFRRIATKVSRKVFDHPLPFYDRTDPKPFRPFTYSVVVSVLDGDFTRLPSRATFYRGVHTFEKNVKLYVLLLKPPTF